MHPSLCSSTSGEELAKDKREVNKNKYTYILVSAESANRSSQTSLLVMFVYGEKEVKSFTAEG